MRKPFGLPHAPFTQERTGLPIQARREGKGVGRVAGDHDGGGVFGQTTAVGTCEMGLQSLRSDGSDSALERQGGTRHMTGVETVAAFCSLPPHAAALRGFY